MDIALALIRFIADFPQSAVKTVTPNLVEIGCYYILAWSVLAGWGNTGDQTR